MSLHPDAKKLWKQIRNPNCTECPLHREAQTVCLVGDGPVPAKAMIVGEAPGFREDDVQKPFAGRAGQLLDKTLQEVGLDRKDVFITNVAKCRPPENRTPTKTEIKACRHYLDAEIEAVNPEFILAVGNSGLSVVRKSGIMKHRGELYELEGRTVLPTVHPAAVLRNPHYENLFRTDLSTFRRLIKDERGARPPKTYLIRDKRGLIAACKAIIASDAVAYDLETNGFDELADDAAIATIAVSPKRGVAFVVPIHHPEATWKRPELVLSAIGHALTYTKGRRIAHNAKFDDRWLNRFGIPIHADFDTMIAAHLLDENRPKSLKVLAQMILGADPWKDVDLSKGGAMTTTLTKLARYNAKDTEYTLALYEYFKRELQLPENRRLGRLFKVLMMPLSHTLTDVEATGLWVDKKRLTKRLVQVQQKLDKINKRLVKVAGEEANWNSPQQLGRIMFGKLGYPMVDVTAKGAPSTKESVLLMLARDPAGGRYEFAELLLEWRKWYKYKSTYFEGWAEQLDEHDRLHPNYKITGTVTGRLSSGKETGSRGRGLNAQQVPRDEFVRSVIGAPSGWRFVEADFSQVELRIAAHYSADPVMRRAYQLQRDIHLETATRMTGKPAEQVTKEERKKAKAVNFGFLFGMGAKKFVEYALDNYELEVDIHEAEEVRRAFFDGFPALRSWHERQRRLVRNYGRVQSLIGRVRHLPDVYSPEREVAGEAERQAINSPVQGLASDFMALSLVLLHQKLDPREALIVGTVHDSGLFEVRDDKVDVWVPIIKNTMEKLPLKKKFGVELDIPIQVDVKVGRYWSQGEDYKL